MFPWLWVAAALACLVGPPRSAEAQRSSFEERRAEQRLWMEKPMAEWMRFLDTAAASDRAARIGLFWGIGDPKLGALRPVFVRVLDDPDLGVRLAVAPNILSYAAFANHRKISNDGNYSEDEQVRAVRVYIQALNQPDSRLRDRAIYQIQSLSPERAVLVLPDLVRVISQLPNESNEWRWVTEFFERLEGAAEPAVGDLIGLLESGDHRAKAHAAILLTSIGEPARRAVPALLKIVRESDQRDVILPANRAVQRIDPRSLPHPSPAARFVAGEVATLRRDDFLAGAAALERLSQIGPDAVEAVPEILRFFDRSEKDFQKDWTWGLVLGSRLNRVDFGDGLIPALLAQIRDDQPAIAHLAAIFLGNGRSWNADAIPGLTALLDRTHGKLKGEVLDVIGGNGRDNDRVVPTLLLGLNDADPEIRLGALRGLNFQEHPTQAAVDAVTKARDDPDQRVRESAARVADSLKFQKERDDHRRSRRPQH